MIEFKIEGVFKITGKGYLVFAKHLNQGKNWKLTEESKLGGIEIKPVLSIPRALDKKGNPRFDLFAFHLKNISDNIKLKEGDIVELTGTEIV
jgi:hypothetical protein